jgi:hypothetical protein
MRIRDRSSGGARGEGGSDPIEPPRASSRIFAMVALRRSLLEVEDELSAPLSLHPRFVTDEDWFGCDRPRGCICCAVLIK